MYYLFKKKTLTALRICISIVWKTFIQIKIMALTLELEVIMERNDCLQRKWVFSIAELFYFKILLELWNRHLHTLDFFCLKIWSSCILWLQMKKRHARFKKQNSKPHVNFWFENWRFKSDVLYLRCDIKAT